MHIGAAPMAFRQLPRRRTCDLADSGGSAGVSDPSGAIGPFVTIKFGAAPQGVKYQTKDRLLSSPPFLATLGSEMNR